MTSQRLVMFLFLLMKMSAVFSQEPLPFCPPLSLNSFLLSRNNTLSCGVPLSRSYLYSKHEAILVLESLPSLLPVGETSSLRLFACRPLEVPESFWRDTYSVSSVVPWTLSSCQAEEVNFWGVIKSKTSIQPVKVERYKEPSNSSSCEWEVRFTPAYEESYTLEIVNDRLRSSVYSSTQSFVSSLQRNKTWAGATRLHVHDFLERGSPSLTCYHKCSIFEKCAYWSQDGKTCIFYTNETLPKLESSMGKVSGIRNNFTGPVYVGGKSKWREERMDPTCREQGRPYNAVQRFKAVSSDSHLSNQSILGNNIAEVIDNRPFCTQSDLEGLFGTDWHWVSFKQSLCSSNIKSEMRSMANEAEVIMQIEPNVETNETFRCESPLENVRLTWYKLYHTQSATTIYAAKSSSSPKFARKKGSEYELFSWTHPSTHIPSHHYARFFKNTSLCIPYPPSRHLTENNTSAIIDSFVAMTPPWQRRPVCTLGEWAVPPGTLQARQKRHWKTKAVQLIVETVNLISYKPSIPREFGYTWEPILNTCRIQHKPRSTLHACLEEAKFSKIYISGDSITGGLSMVLKWMLTQNFDTKWYLKAQKITPTHVLLDSSPNASRSSVLIKDLSCPLLPKSRCIKSLIDINSPSPYLFITNFRIQHLLRDMSLHEFESSIAHFFASFREARSVGKINPSSRFVFVTAMAMLHFRVIFCTTARAESYSEVVSYYARRTEGWVVIDAFNMTLTRPDLSQEGMHFDDSISYMIVQMMMNHLCSPI